MLRVWVKVVHPPETPRRGHASRDLLGGGAHTFGAPENRAVGRWVTGARREVEVEIGGVVAPRQADAKRAVARDRRDLMHHGRERADGSVDDRSLVAASPARRRRAR